MKWIIIFLYIIIITFEIATSSSNGGTTKCWEKKSKKNNYNHKAIFYLFISLGRLISFAQEFCLVANRAAIALQLLNWIATVKNNKRRNRLITTTKKPRGRERETSITPVLQSGSPAFNKRPCRRANCSRKSSLFYTHTYKTMQHAIVKYNIDSRSLFRTLTFRSIRQCRILSQYDRVAPYIALQRWRCCWFQRCFYNK